MLLGMFAFGELNMIGKLVSRAIKFFSSLLPLLLSESLVANLLCFV